MLITASSVRDESSSPRRITWQQHGEIGIELTGEKREQPPARMALRTRRREVKGRAWDFNVELERQIFLPAQAIGALRHLRETQ